MTLTLNRENTGTDRRSIVLVTVDSLRADHCSFMGYGRETTPALDALASEGLVFEHAVAPGPSTPESMPVIFTGNRVHDVTGVASRDVIHQHLSRTRTIPERLAGRGYTTIGFTANPFTSRYFGFDRGFDRFEDFLSADRTLKNRIVSRWIEGESVAGLRFAINMIGRGDVSTTWGAFYDELLACVGAAPEPFFLWVFLLEPHWPYRPPKRYRTDASLPEMYYYNWLASNLSNATPSANAHDGLRSLYDGTIRHVDEFVGLLTRDLRERDPIVVVHADHGEAFGEHGSYGHGEHLYEENVHVPFVIGNVGDVDDVDNGHRIGEPISLRSLPSILESLADGEKAFRGHEHEFTRSWVTAHAGESAAVRGRDWKLLRERDRSAFYDLRADPRETAPRADDRLAELCDRILRTERRDRSERARITAVTERPLPMDL
jgi:arylsulfatase